MNLFRILGYLIDIMQNINLEPHVSSMYMSNVLPNVCNSNVNESKTLKYERIFISLTITWLYAVWFFLLRAGYISRIKR